MARYLIKANYTVDGTKGVLKEGGTSRRAAVTQMIEGLGGSLEAFYYAFGECDAFVIADVPDAVTAAAISLAVNASGAVTLSTLPLLIPEEIDQASTKTIGYRSPGT